MVAHRHVHNAFDSKREATASHALSKAASPFLPFHPDARQQMTADTTLYHGYAIQALATYDDGAYASVLVRIRGELK
jgi:hypothetical protein